MSTDTFSIRLQKGITGGFAPPVPDAVYIITRTANSDTFTVITQIRPKGTPSLQPPNSKDLQVADYIDEISKLLDLLCDLPVQYPGAEDLYGLNTSILLNPGEHHPTGSFAGQGIPRPTDEQKAKFSEAVVIIDKWAAL